MSIEVIAWSISDGLALIRIEGKLYEVKPPYTAGLTSTTESAISDAFRHWGFHSPPKEQAIFDSLDGLYSVLREALKPTLEQLDRIHKNRKPLIETPVARLNAAEAFKHLRNTIRINRTPVTWRRALAYLTEFAELPNVSSNKLLKEHVLAECKKLNSAIRLELEKETKNDRR